MNLSFEASGFELETTKDGSPTLKLRQTGESMHHSAGAASETWYIYGAVIKAVMDAEISTDIGTDICTVGLGLGYIEMVWALLQENNQSTHLDTFEISPELRNNFTDWIQEKKTSQSAVYDLAASHLVQISGLLGLTDLAFVTKDIQRKLRSQKLQIHEDICEFKAPKKWNIICFDAFCNKTDNQLWTADYLDLFLSRHTQTECVFTTYASTRTLKDALRKHDFKLLNRPGFSGKRESTLAVRGLKMNPIFQTF